MQFIKVNKNYKRRGMASFFSVVFMILNVTQGAQAGDVNAVEKKYITLSAIENSHYNILTGNIIREAYRRIGYDALIEYLPGNRALRKSSQGQVGGEVSRIYAIGERYDSLIRIPVPFLSLKGTVFTRDSNIHIENKEDLAPYKIGILRGIIYAEKLTEGYNVASSNSTRGLFNMLMHDRVDLVLVTELTGRIALKRLSPDHGVNVSKNPLLEIPVYHYLHQDKKDLAPLIEASLKSMHESGEAERMKEKFMNTAF